MNINRKENNFDMLRLLFAVIVVIVHMSDLSNIEAIGKVSRFFSSEIAVDSFFIISGFLIFMSYNSTSTLKKYLNKRMRRIFPGYFAVIILSSLLLFFVSTKGVTEYFNIDFLKYIVFNLLTLNFMQPTLPGVFENNPMEAVNGALWTIKIEVLFYLLVPLIASILSKTNKVFILGIIYSLSVLYSLTMVWLSSHYDMEIFMRFEKQIPGQLAFFISGAFLYYFYESFYKISLWIFLLSIVILFIHKFIFDVYILYPASLAVIVIYFATIFKYLGDFGKFGDLSFGVYIWHFPIIQLFIYYNLFSNLLLGIVLFIVCIFIVSYLSWHLVEKRFLYKSSHYIVAEK